MENSLINKLDRLVSAFIFAVILALILSMIVGFVKGFLNIGQLFLDSREPPTEQIFHGVAVTLIFVKSY